LKIQHKILLAFAPLCLVGILSMAFLFYRLAEHNILRKTSEANLNTLQQITEKIGIINNNIISVSNMYFLDNNMRKLLQTDWHDKEYEEKLAFEPVNAIFQLMKNNFYYLNHMTTLLGFNGNYYTEDRENRSGQDLVRSTNWTSKLDDEPNKVLWTDTYLYNDHYIFSAVNYLRDIYTGKPIGVLILDFDEEILFTTYKHMSNKDIMILSSSGNVLSSANKSLLSTNYGGEAFFEKLKPYQSGYFVTEMMDKNMLVSFYKVPQLGWFIVDMIPLPSLLKEMNEIKNYVLIIALLTIICLFILSYALSHAISSPIKKLVASMNRVHIDGLNPSYMPNRRDEAGILVMKYNVMLDKINELIRETIRQQQLKRKAEIQALQAQIKPHFLYNTLSSIRWMAKSGNIEVVNRMVISLVRLLRQTFESGNEYVTYAEEESFLSDYVYIQKVRYGDKFEVVFDFAEELRDGNILKLLIQPILENAIFHGIEPKEGNGTIKVKAFPRNGDVVICIHDDGVGSNAFHSANGNSRPDHNRIHVTGGLGLRSIEERIKLHFGEKYGLTVISEQGRGTQVSVTIPWLKKEDGGLS
jgi:two-component system sensor histidine kinase YesM